MKKRGVSGVLTIIIIVFLVIVGFSILYLVLNGFQKDTASEVRLEPVLIDLDLQNAYISPTNDSAIITVFRTGAGNISKLKFIFIDENGVNYVYDYPLGEGFPGENEKRIYNISSKSINGLKDFSKIKSISIAFSIDTGSGKELTSVIKDTFGKSPEENIRNSNSNLIVDTPPWSGGGGGGGGGSGGGGGENPACVPNCNGKQCGDNGCGVSCGSCNDNNLCTSDVCSNYSCNFSPKSCSFGTSCDISTGECSIQIDNNKNMTQYSINQTFLVSDNNWKEVLPYVPLTIWTNKSSHVEKYPYLIYHEENFTNKSINIQKEELLKNTGLSVSWNFINNSLGNGTVSSDSFSIIFNLSDDMYDKMKKGIPRGDLNLGIEKIDPAGNTQISYEVYFNSVELSSKYIYIDSQNPNIGFMDGAFWGKEKSILQKTNNNLTLIRTGGNMIIKNYTLFTPYFATDSIYDNCMFNPGEFTIYDLCISDVNFTKLYLNSGEFFTYSVTVKNIGNEVTDLTNTSVIFQGVYYDPGSLGNLYKSPYSIIMSHKNTTIPKVLLNPDDSTIFNITLIYDKSENLPNYAFDADSIIYFMQQYVPTNLSIIGKTSQSLDNLIISPAPLGAGLNTNKIRRINISNYLSFWKNYSHIVYCEENYTLALLASTYASLLNAPLIIKNSYLDNQVVYNGKNIICVGDVNPSGNICVEKYNLGQLQDRYFNITQTDKFMLVNPNDLQLKSFYNYRADKSSDDNYNLYTKDSLASPILASYKKELIIPITSNDLYGMDTSIHSKIGRYYTTTDIYKTSCKPLESCSSGFDKTVNKTFYIGSNIVYNITSIAGTGPYKMYLYGSFICDSGKIFASLYNNGRFLVNKSFDCSNIEKTFVDGGHNYFSDINELEAGNLELRFSGANFSINPDYLLQIYDSNWNTAFYCSSINNDCAPKLDPVIITRTLSNTTSYFNITSFNSNDTNYITVKFLSKDIDNISIYVNDNLLRFYPYSSSYYTTFSFKINSSFGNNIQVKIVPGLYDYSGYDPLYYAYTEVNTIPKPKYSLTIVASPESVPFYKRADSTDDCGEASKIEVDGRFYGSLNNYKYINFPVGRITGLSISDVSGYIARDIFFDRIPKNKDALLVIKEDYQNEIYDICNEFSIYDECAKNETSLGTYARRYFWTNEIRNQFDNEYFYSGTDYIMSKQNEIYKNYSQVFLNLFDDHGYPGGFAGMMDVYYMKDNKVNLKPSFTIGLACSTCSYYGQGDLFCMQGIRRGALAQQGAVDVSYWHQEFDDILTASILQNKTIGEAYMEARNDDYVKENYNFCGGLVGDPFYSLLGDPNWRPRWW